MTELKRCPECGGVATVIHMQKEDMPTMKSRSTFLTARCRMMVTKS